MAGTSFEKSTCLAKSNSARHFCFTVMLIHFLLKRLLPGFVGQRKQSCILVEDHQLRRHHSQCSCPCEAVKGLFQSQAETPAIHCVNIVCLSLILLIVKSDSFRNGARANEHFSSGERLSLRVNFIVFSFIEKDKECSSVVGYIFIFICMAKVLQMLAAATTVDSPVRQRSVSRVIFGEKMPSPEQGTMDWAHRYFLLSGSTILPSTDFLKSDSDL